ncbi:hypothetical protein IFM89_022421 [Coptis chinensis]|uniref:Uncharacterized protein n=1 Tax=Coptis chinensis TaxID=261450 RepID=A0A835I5E8_9MAGN|nr:hypothetical protein IFM89_022421 [Coptis chinensis]
MDKLRCFRPYIIGFREFGFEAVKEIQRSLTELQQVFLDMAKSLVDGQGEQMDDIELNVANARVYIDVVVLIGLFR